MSQSADPIHVAVTCDESYAMPLAAMLASLASHLDPHRRLVIHALGYELPAQVWDQLAVSLPHDRAEWDSIDVDAAELLRAGFTTRTYDHISPVCYFRLLLPELLPHDLKKVLYVDCDLIIRDDVSTLWDTDIGDTEFAAAPELSAATVNSRLADDVRFHRELGIPGDQIQFNSGVLLINLDRWRKSRFAMKVFTYLRVLGEDIHWYEQEAMNVVAKGRFRELDRRWNVPSQWAGQLPHDQVSTVHYLTAQKPWNWDYRWPVRDLFFSALDRTPWAGWRPVRPRLGRPRRFIRRLGKALRKRAHAAHRAGVMLQRHLTYRSTRLTGPDSGTRIPSQHSAGSEIRLFMAIDGADVALLRILEAHFLAGADRAFLLDCRGQVDISGLSPALQPRTHLFSCSASRRAHGLRHLLDRFGDAHWCVLGNEHQILVDSHGRPVSLRDQCASLDAAGFEIVDAVTGSGDRLEMTARDLRSGRVFLGTALVGPTAHDYDRPEFRSRAALVKYSKTMLLDADGVLSGNARKGECCLRLRSLGDSGAL